MLFADLLSLHLATFLMLFILVYCSVLAILSASDLAISSKMFDTLPKTDLFLNTNSASIYRDGNTVDMVQVISVVPQ